MTAFVRSTAYPWVLTGIFAAIHTILALIPSFPAIGVEGGTLSLGMISGPMVGFLLGPFFGTIAVIIGSIIAGFVNPAILVIGPFTVIATATGALVAGLIRVGKPFFVPIIYVIVIVFYLIGPLGLLLPVFVWFHLICLALSFLFVLPKVSDLLKESIELKPGFSPIVGFIGAWLLSIIALVADQGMGSMLGVFYLVYGLSLEADTVAGFFVVVTFVYPIERLLASIFLTIIIFALGSTLAKTYFDLPTKPWEDMGIRELPEEEIEPEPIDS
jgi:hypothetical protein